MQPTEQEKIFANHIPNTGLIYKMIEITHTTQQPKSKELDLKNGQRYSIDIVPKKTYKWPTGT